MLLQEKINPYEQEFPSVISNWSECQQRKKMIASHGKGRLTWQFDAGGFLCGSDDVSMVGLCPPVVSLRSNDTDHWLLVTFDSHFLQVLKNEYETPWWLIPCSSDLEIENKNTRITCVLNLITFAYIEMLIDVLNPEMTQVYFYWIICHWLVTTKCDLF